MLCLCLFIKISYKIFDFRFGVIRVKNVLYFGDRGSEWVCFLCIRSYFDRAYLALTLYK